MIVRRTAPYLFAVRPVWLRGAEAHASVVVRARFTLDDAGALQLDPEQGTLSGERYAPDDLDRLGAPLCVDDFVPLKAHPEWVVLGRCFVPDGRPVPRCAVGVTLGASSKALRVVGPRVWSDARADAVLSDPVAFTEMPIDWTRALGGPGDTANPAGCGLASREAPNVESPAAPLAHRSDRPGPAGYGPLNARWAPRAVHLGRRYDAAWRSLGGRGYADDFDLRYFQCAPADQWLPEGLRGDEPFRLHNLHPTRPVLGGRLPGVRVRAIVRVDDGSTREVSLRLDTVVFEPNDARVTLTWRGLTAVPDDTLTALRALLVVHEALDEAPRPLAEYAARLDDALADPQGIEATLRAHLPPDEAERALAVVRHAEGRPVRAAPDPVEALLDARAPHLQPAERARVTAALTQAVEKLGADNPKALLDRAALQRNPEPPVAVPLQPGVLPDLRLRAKVRAIMARVDALREAADKAKQPIDPARLAPLLALPTHPRWRQLDPAYTPPEPLSTDAPGPGANLFERDLAFADLEGVDLSGANLEGALLTGARLRGAVLRNARLVRAVLYRADLTDADLSGADLTRCNALAVVARGARFDRATLDGAHFAEATLEGAVWDDARGQYVVCTDCLADGLSARRAEISRSDFTRAALRDARFAHATLRGTTFEAARAPGASFVQATLVNARFVDAVLEGARWRLADATRGNFSGATLTGGDLRLGVFRRTLWLGAALGGCRFDGADLRDARLDGARLDDARLDDANLFEASLRRVSLRRVSLRRANLYGADLRDAAGAGADLLDATLTRSTLDPGAS